MTPSATDASRAGARNLSRKPVNSKCMDMIRGMKLVAE